MSGSGSSSSFFDNYKVDSRDTAAATAATQTAQPTEAQKQQAYARAFDDIISSVSGDLYNASSPYPVGSNGQEIVVGAQQPRFAASSAPKYALSSQPSRTYTNVVPLESSGRTVPRGVSTSTPYTTQRTYGAGALQQGFGGPQ